MDWEAACNLIDATDWAALLDEEDINKRWQNWQKRFLDILDQCIPKATYFHKLNPKWNVYKL